MAEETLTYKQALAEIDNLRLRLEEAEEALHAIQSGQVDALVVSTPEGEQIYTLVGAERTYRILVEAMNEGALVLSPEGYIVYSNRTFAAILGAPLGEVIGAYIYDFVAESDVEPLKKLLKQALYRSSRKEINLKHVDSGSVPVFLSVGNLETDEGPAISAVVTDLTEHKRTEAELEKYREHLEELVIERTQELLTANEHLKLEIKQRERAEESLRESEIRFRTLANGTPLIIWVADATGRIQFVNNAYCEFFDATLEEVQARGWQSLVHPDDYSTYVEEFFTCLQEHKPFFAQARVLRSDGEWRWIESYGEPRFSPSGEYLGIAGSSLDITERKQAEEDIFKAHAETERKAAQLESFFSSMADGVVLFDTNGNALMMNESGKSILDIPPDANPYEWSSYQRFTLDGKPLPLEDSAPFRALRGEVVQDMRYKVVSQWGKEIIISITASPVRDSEGRIIGATTIFRDVTDVVEFERQKEELFEKEHRISEALQQALVPSLAPYSTHGLSIATRYQSALQEAQVGGDFYDIFELGEGKIGVLIGDVAGKGLQAAIRVAAARHSIRSYAYIDPSPGKVMTLANEALVRSDPDRLEVSNALTAFFAVVDTNNGIMSYATAGHEPPVVCNIDSSVNELEVTGIMLGIIAGSQYNESTYKLREGDSVVMFTDGITEARRSSTEFFDKSGVIEHLTRCCDASPEEIAEALLKAASSYAGGNLQDDVAIVVLKYSNNATNRE